jgi:hypothetical protein
MSEAETVEVEQEEVATANPLGELIDAIAAQNFNQAKSQFDDILGDKMNDALDAEKIAVADTIFNGAEEEQLDIDLDLDDAEEEVDTEEDITPEED